MERAPSPGHVIRYGLAVALVGAGTGLSFLIRPLTEGSPFILYFLAAILAARFGGLGSGMLATVLGGTAALYFFIAPRFSFEVASPTVASALVGFLLVSCIACWITSVLGMAQERLRRVLDSIWEGFVVLDPQWRAVYLNRRMADFVGKRPEELVGKRMMDVFPAVTEMPLFAELRRAMVERRPTHIEAYFPTRDAWFESNVVPAEHGLALFIRDVSERKRMQQKLESTLADLSRSNHELERFASSISHDWVQPLSTIMINAWTLQEQSSGELRQCALKIIEDAKRMSDLLRSRRDNSKAGPHADDLESTSLDGVLEHVRQALAGVLAGKGITIASDGLPTVKADPMLMRQALHSLISCHLKVSVGGPGRLRFSAQENSHSWVVSLHSCADGASSGAAAIDHDDDFTISKRIVELHGGRLWSETGADGVPTVHFTLPISRPVTLAGN